MPEKLPISNPLHRLIFATPHTYLGYTSKPASGIAAIDDSLRNCQSILLSPYNTNIIKALGDILDLKASRPATNIGLIITCEEYTARAERVANMLSHPAVPFEVKIVVGDNTTIDNNNIMKVQAKDTYEALTDKVSSAFMEIATNHAAPTNVFKIDDDIDISDIELFSSSCLSLISEDIDYAGFPVGEPITIELGTGINAAKALIDLFIANDITDHGQMDHFIICHQEL